MNPHLATLLARDPHIFEPLPVILECEHMLIDAPKGPSLDGRTAVTLTNDTTNTTASVIVPNEDLPALVAAIGAHIKEKTA